MTSWTPGRCADGGGIKGFSFVASLIIVAAEAALLLFHPDSGGGCNRSPRAPHHIVTLSAEVGLGSTSRGLTCNLFEPLLGCWGIEGSWPVPLFLTGRTTIVRESFWRSPDLCSLEQNWVRMTPGSTVAGLKWRGWEAVSWRGPALLCSVVTACLLRAITPSRRLGLSPRARCSLLSWDRPPLSRGKHKAS